MNLDLNIQYPLTICENLEFRGKLHNWLSKDIKAQQDFVGLMKIKPTIFFDLVAWTYNPDLPIGAMNVPFIVSVRPAQVKAVLTLKEAIEGRKDVGINKGRKEGATELLMKYVAFMILFYPDVSFLVGSRSEELVDKTGDPSTLFAKIDYTFKFLPMWLTKLLHIERNFKHIKNLDLNATVDGEATNENFGAGKRVTALILDEFGRVSPNLAQSIADTVRPISECCIVNSTHFFGPNHAFNKFLLRRDIKKIELFWWENPEENKGLYYDNDSKEWPIPVRSPWFDKEVERSASRRDVMMNLFADPCGSSEQFFDPVVNAIIRTKCKYPNFEGNISFEEGSKGLINIKFDENAKQKKLRWFGNLIRTKDGLRPNPLHNYIVGCDIGFGSGASNSPAEIFDVNTGENVGEYVSADKTPEEFADIVVALCKWIGGGTGEAFLIFENNGGQGGIFSKRVVSRGLSLIYTKTTEQKKSRKRLNEFGWTSSRKEKEFMLGNLQAALKEGLKDKPIQKFIKIYNEIIVDELNSYIFYDTGTIDSSETIDENTSARARHGDRVIAIGLCVLAINDQAKMKEIPSGKIPFNSFAWRQQQRKQTEANKEDSWREGKKILKGW